ncbi:MAG TPA: cell division protein ZapA [Sphingomicrobium sp.]|nr:cell division protein ZapA [Sphingomicrobium sp.]
MAEIDVFIAGRAYKVACRDGEEDSLRKAASLVDAKSREALAGLGTLSEARQLLFASLLLADDLVDDGRVPAPPPPPAVDPAVAERAERIADRLESLASALEVEAARS